jgi:hypothetical protein
MSGFCGVASPLNEQGSAFVPNDPARRNYAAARSSVPSIVLKPPKNK